MTALRLIARTTSAIWTALVLVERKELHAVGPARATTSRNEPERSGTSEREPCSRNGAVRT